MHRVYHPGSGAADESPPASTDHNEDSTDEEDITTSPDG